MRYGTVGKVAGLVVLLSSCVFSGCPGSDEDKNTVEQSPIEFVLVNDSAATIYLDWSEWPDFWRSSGPCEFQGSDGEWEACQLGVPVCMSDCDDESTYDFCETDCDPIEKIRIVGPGETLSYYAWEGEMYHPDGLSWNGLDCTCYDAGDPAEGRYRFSIETFLEIECMETDCSDADGDSIVYAEPSGEATVHSAELDVPFAETQITIIVE